MGKSVKRRTANARTTSRHDDEGRLNKLEGRLLALEAQLADVQAVIGRATNYYEERLSERDRAIDELKQQVRYASKNAAKAVALLNGNESESGPLASPLGPMSNVQPTPIDHRRMKGKR